MGLYSKALAINKKPDTKGLLKKSLEIREKYLPGASSGEKQEQQEKINETIRLPAVIPAVISAAIMDEIKQQINLCKANKLSLAIVTLSCSHLVADVIRNNNSVDAAVLRANIFSFMEQFFTDETRIYNLGSDLYLFTLYNPNTVDPELVLFQLAEILRYNVPDISEDVAIGFDKTIRFYPDNGEDIETLLNDAV